MLYVKIDRATGTIVAKEHKDDPKPELGNTRVWLPYYDDGVPAYDASKNDMSRTEDIPDLSDLSEDVPEDALVQVKYTLTPLSQAEIDSRAEAEAQSQFDNAKMLKAVAIWTAQKLNIPLATARTEIKAIYRSLT